MSVLSLCTVFVCVCGVITLVQPRSLVLKKSYFVTVMPKVETVHRSYCCTGMNLVWIKLYMTVLDKNAAVVINIVIWTWKQLGYDVDILPKTKSKQNAMFVKVFQGSKCFCQWFLEMSLECLQKVMSYQCPKMFLKSETNSFFFLIFLCYRLILEGSGLSISSSCSQSECYTQ